MQQPPNQNPYPNQYPSQQNPPPYYPPMPQQQQPKKRGRGCLIGGVIAAIVLVIIIVAAAANGGKGGTPTASSGNTGQSNQSTTAPTSSTHKVGDSITVNGWTVTLNSAKVNTTGTAIAQPKTGNEYLLVDVTILNSTGKSQPVSSIIQFALKDDSGQGYTEALGASDAKTPDGTLANGSKLRGVMGYEVPKSSKSYELDFTPGLATTDQAIWNFSV